MKTKMKMHGTRTPWIIIEETPRSDVRDISADALPRDVKAWITVNGAHIPIMKWQTKNEAVKEFTARKGRIVGVNREKPKTQRTPFLDFRDRAYIQRSAYASPSGAVLAFRPWENVKSVLKTVNKNIAFGQASRADRTLRRYAALKPRYDAVIARSAKIAGDMENAVRASGGELYGKEHGIKGVASLERKIRDKISKAGERKVEGNHSAKIFSNMTDIVRFTALFDAQSLAKNTERLVEKLKIMGYHLIEVNNKWLDTVQPYRGLHFLFSKNGETFEVQVHSPNSMAMKDKLHSLYEISRDTTRPAAERIAAKRKQAELAKGCVMPKGVDKFINWKRHSNGGGLYG